MKKKKIPVLIMLVSVAAVSAATLAKVAGSPLLSETWRLPTAFTGFIVITMLCSYFSYLLFRK